ncbi:hypothetical protein SEUCBS140593_009179 [Sporothrix eucalyptigena]|uniref:Microbial-type PARG catalytic domain-containing protein n=1 Tax=Sporothrix eucalyptigena TaxID=1812306 RepID=A0ABP0CVZ2_9PEZI
MTSSALTSKLKASSVATETRLAIPEIQKHYAHLNMGSVLYKQPSQQPSLERIPRPFGRLPEFHICDGDPAMTAINRAAQLTCQTGKFIRVPLICSADEKRPGGDWRMNVDGSEMPYRVKERLCRRSTLWATLGTPATPSLESACQTNYPIPIDGGILSEEVVVFRGPDYKKLPPSEWGVLPVVSVPPVRWPKLTETGTRYSLDNERNIVKDKLRASLLICIAKGYSVIVVGDFGLGKRYRNPPQEMAKLWCNVFLWDVMVRGRIQAVTFVFEDPQQCTTHLIRDALSNKGRGDGSRGMSSSSLPSTFSSSSLTSSPTDLEIFRRMFSKGGIKKQMEERDYRYELQTLVHLS